MTHKTKGIILRAVSYGETSVIATVFTELFGIQSYIVKGVRKSGKASRGAQGYFQPAAILDMQVYHNQLKNLQFIKEYQWACLYQQIFFNVIKNASAVYMVELLQHSLKQPEASPELFSLIETSLTELDTGNEMLTANLPLFFSLQLAAQLGLRIQGEFSDDTPVVDLYEGSFVKNTPGHQHYLAGDFAKAASQINDTTTYRHLQNIRLNRGVRRNLLNAFLQFFKLHIQDFGDLKSMRVLQEVL